MGTLVAGKTMCKHILNATVAVRAQCCRKWFDCPQCHAESADHELKKTTTIVMLARVASACSGLILRILIGTSRTHSALIATRATSSLLCRVKRWLLLLPPLQEVPPREAPGSRWRLRILTAV